MTFRRFALYHLPDDADFADWGAAWLGWDIRSGRALSPPDDALSARPRRYGFHATLKPPFAPVRGTMSDDLMAALGRFGADHGPVTLPGLSIQPMGRFLAFVPDAPSAALDALAWGLVTRFDRFRAPMPPEEFDRRARGLRADKRDYLTRWGYPHLGPFFRFHLTLTGPLAPDIAPRAEQLLRDNPCPVPRPFRVGSVSLVGEDTDGFFHEIHRQPLTGPPAPDAMPWDAT